MRLEKNALVIVANGEGARIYRNAKPDGLHLGEVEFMQPGDMADQGPSGRTPPDMSVRDQLEATFAKILVQRLNDMALKHEYDQIVIIADPVTLGQMRPLYHKELEKRLVRDLAKTLTNASAGDIEKALA